MNSGVLVLLGLGYFVLKGTKSATGVASNGLNAGTSPAAQLAAQNAVAASNNSLAQTLAKALQGGGSKAGGSSPAGNPTSGLGSGASSSTGANALSDLEYIASPNRPGNSVDSPEFSGVDGLLSSTPVPTYDGYAAAGGNYTPTPTPIDTISSDTSNQYVSFDGGGGGGGGPLMDAGDYASSDFSDWGDF